MDGIHAVLQLAPFTHPLCYMFGMQATLYRSVQQSQFWQAVPSKAKSMQQLQTMPMVDPPRKGFKESKLSDIIFCSWF